MSHKKLAALGSAAFLLAATLSVGGCGTKFDDLGEELGLGGSSAIDDEILEGLRVLFPDLSESELVEISASFDIEELLALKAELEAVRDAAAEFSANLFKSAEEHVADRAKALEPENDGFPEGLEPVGRICLYDTAKSQGRIELSGVFDGKAAAFLTESNLSLTVGGTPATFQLECRQGGSTVDVVFLIDITGSMSNVIDAVRDSVVSFVDALEESGLQGTVSFVSYQDSVGVNTTFQEPAPKNDYERSPFFKPVSLANAAGVDAARAFVNRLEANRGADAPENLAAALDFARNNVIGYTASGAPNVIGEGSDDPEGTSPFPKLTSDHQVFVALTDITFHGDANNESNSSLLAPFDPRKTSEILNSLQATQTVVHVSDPSWVDEPVDPSGNQVDADYWAMHTGGIGEDRVLGYSLVDLELVVVAKESGLLDITLDKILASSCSLTFDATVAANAAVNLSLDLGAGKQFSEDLKVERY